MNTRLLARRLLRDVRSHGSQFLSVFAMTVLGIAVFGGLDATWRGMQAALDTLDQQGGMPTLWVTTTGSTEGDLDALRAHEGVDDTDRVTSFTMIHPRDGETSGALSATTMSESAVDVPITVDGAPIDQADEGGVWIDVRYAESNGIAVRDLLPVEIGASSAELEVRGLVVLPDGIVYTGPGLASRASDDFGQAVVTLATAQALGIPDLGDQVRVIGDERASDAVDAVFADRVVSARDRDLNVFVAPAFDRVDQLRVLSLMFSALFVLVAVLAMSSSVRRLVELQRSDIAAFRAIGLSTTVVGLYYSAIAAVVVGAGALVGLALAPVLARFVIATQWPEFALVSWDPVFDWTVAAVALGLVVVGVLSAWTASRSTRRLTPAEALQPVLGGPSRLAQALRGPLFSKLGHGSRWTIRDAIGHPGRLAMGIVACAGCMMLLFVGFGMPESLGREIDIAYEDQYRYDTWVVVNPASTPDQLQQLEDAAGPGQWVMQGYGRVGDDDSMDRVLTVLDDGDLFVVRDADGAVIDLADGPAVSGAVSEDRGLARGDETLIIPARGASAAVTVDTITPLSQPQGVFLSRADWVQTGAPFLPTAYLAERAVTAGDLAGAPAAIGLASHERQESNARNVVESLGGVFTMMKAVAVILAVVALYNLGALSFSERTRDYATLRVLGFRNRELRRLAFLENGITTVLGWGLGIPLGIWFLAQFVSIFGTFRAVYHPYLSPTSFLLISAITVVSALSTTLLLTRRIRRIDMTAALKGVE